jgi:hypothetical protein
MTIISAPCFLFVYNPFTKVQQSEVMELTAGTTMVSNYNDVGLTLFIGSTQAECDDKIIELQLTPVAP